MMRRILFIAAYATVSLLLGCNRTPETLKPEAYVNWISSADNGYVKERKIGSAALTVRYLPAYYLAYKEFQNSSNENPSFDSLYNAYRCSLSFQLILSADKSDRTYGNLKYYGLQSADEFPQRANDLNFGAGEYFSIEYDGKIYRPVMHVFEGFDNLNNSLSFVMVFELPEYNCGNPAGKMKNIRFSFNDSLWNLGMNHFEFQRAVFESKPKLKI